MVNMQICPHCTVRVVPTAEGICPNCRQHIADHAAVAGTRSPDAPPVVVTPPEQFAPMSRATAENPFSAPQVSADDSPIYIGDGPTDRGLAWALFLFRGRIPRRTYWGLSIATIVAYYMSAGVLAVIERDVNSDLIFIAFIPIMIIFFWANLAIQVKRWHDRGKSGFWFLVNLVPIVGPLIAFVELGCLRGTHGINQYGPDPT